jgi:hypothetical protein
MHFVRCPVYVHQFPNATMGGSYQDRLLARYDADGKPLPSPINKERADSAQQRSASTTKLSAALHRTAGANSKSWNIQNRKDTATLNSTTRTSLTVYRPVI